MSRQTETTPSSSASLHKRLSLIQFLSLLGAAGLAVSYLLNQYY